jgi:hypothetical protein
VVVLLAQVAKLGGDGGLGLVQLVQEVPDLEQLLGSEGGGLFHNRGASRGVNQGNGAPSPRNGPAGYAAKRG